LADAPLVVFIFLLRFALLPISFYQQLWSTIIANVLFQVDRQVIFLAITFKFLFYVPALSFFSFVELAVQAYPLLRISIACFF